MKSVDDFLAPFRKRLLFLREAFQLKLPVYLEFRLGVAQELITSEREHRIVIGPGTHLLDIDDLVATAKLGEEYDILLATMYFQRDLTEEEKKLASLFTLHTAPIRDYWAYRVMKEYLPEDEFQKNLEEIINLEKAFSGEGKIAIKHTTLMFRKIGVKLILETFADGISIRLGGEYGRDWNQYVEVLQSLKDEAPSAEILTRIPDEIGAPYVVSISNEEYRHFVIKKREEILG